MQNNYRDTRQPKQSKLSVEAVEEQVWTVFSQTLNRKNKPVLKLHDYTKNHLHYGKENTDGELIEN